jgi:hypothetical protein
MADRFSQVVSAYGPRLEKEFGFTVVQASGFWGNFARETGEFKHYQEIGSTANTGGRGWAQWTGPRRVAFLGYCAAHKIDPKADESSFSYVLVELHGAYKSVVTAVKKCKTIENATTTVEKLYEGAGVKAMSQRVALAHKAYTIRTGAPATPAPKPVAKPKAAAKSATKKATVLARKARPKRRRA